jgi:phospholipase C
MGFFDETQLNYYYFMAANFAMSDNLHSPLPANTTPNRMFLHAATSQGFAHIPSRVLTSKTIWQELDAKGVSWKIYVTDFSRSFKTYLSFFTYFNQAGVQAKIVPITEYFSDLTAGTLPSVAMIEAGYFSGLDEHTSNINPALGAAAPINVQAGAAQVASIINPLMTSSSWKDSVFLFAFDEGGGALDHAPPVAVPSPDGIPPQDLEPIFELFAKSSHGMRIEEGLGIGLYLARHLIEAHGGTITAASPGLGRGSEFVIQLPCEESTG